MTDEEFLLLRGMVSLAQVDDWYSAEEDRIIRNYTNLLRVKRTLVIHQQYGACAQNILERRLG